MLLIRGHLVSCIERTGIKKNGEKFLIHQGVFLGNTFSNPVSVQLGDQPLTPGSVYELEVYVRLYPRKDGSFAYQLSRPKSGFVNNLSEVKKHAV